MDLYSTQVECDSYLNKIGKLFTPDCKITLIVRKPDNDNADFVMTIDELDKVSELIERTKQRKVKDENKTI